MRDETWHRENDVGNEGSAFEEEVEEDKEDVNCKGADVECVEGGDVGLCAVFLCFLRHGMENGWMDSSRKKSGRLGKSEL